MVKIGICDDMSGVIGQLKGIISTYTERKQKPVEIYSFLSGKSLLKEIKMIDILFLDIEMPDMDGIETGMQILKKNERCRIIMATSHLDRFKETYKIRAFRFVSKPFEPLEVEEALEDAIESISWRGKICLFMERISYDIEQRDIQLLYAVDSNVEAYVKGKVMRSERSLTQMEQKLDKKLFYRVNRKYIVNFYYIQEYDAEKIYIGKHIIKISRGKKKDFEKRFVEFDLKYR